MLHAALLGATLCALPVRIQSDACPSPLEIERALVPLLPAYQIEGRPDLARVTRRGPWLEIELVSPDGAVIVERSIAQEGSCAELAQVVAVVIASWESDVHPTFARPQPELRPSLPSDGQRARSAPRSHASYDLYAGAGLSVAETVAFSGALAAAWIPRGTGLGLLANAAGESQHKTTLGERHAEWRRWAGSTEIDWRLGRGRTVLDLHGGLLFGFLTANGRDFSPNRSASSFSPGLTAGVRISLWTDHALAVCLGVSGLLWQRNQVLTGPPPTRAEQEITHFQGLATIGLAAGRPPRARVEGR